MINKLQIFLLNRKSVTGVLGVIQIYQIIQFKA